MHFKYVDNRKGGAVIFKCEATNIAEADAALKKETGVEAVKSPWIGCIISLDEKL
jgi:hypothetical protein